MKDKKTIWFDFTNVPHINFLLPIIKHLSSYYQIYSIRDFAETKSLFQQLIAKEYYLVGQHKGSNKLLKTIGSLNRIISLQKVIPHFDIKISVGGDASSIVAKLRGKKSITFDDNEKAPNWRYSRFSDLAFWPRSINPNILYKQGFKEHKIFRYDGFKEDLYIADYVPDKSFLKKIPFSNYVVVRSENNMANYVDGHSKSITPRLLDLLNKMKINVLFLPRYNSDKILSKDYENIYTPTEAINGLDACYYSDAVFTGAGTMAREAACLGVPAFSFYAGKELLTVDQTMIENNWLFFSRDPKQLIDKYLTASKRSPDLIRPKKVKKQILERIDSFIIDSD